MIYNQNTQITEIITLAKKLFTEDLLGVCLYGSSVLGGLRPNSDLDLLILLKTRLSEEARKILTRRLLEISGEVGCTDKRPMEVTVLCHKDLVPWHFPPRYEYMYGEWLRTEIEAGMIPCAEHDPDLAILLWQARTYGISLVGDPIEAMLPSIPFQDIQKAIRDSLPSLISNITQDERNVLLTLCRMWYTLATGTICSKDAAARWVLPRLPQEYVSLVEMAEKAYLGETTDCWEEKKDLLVQLGTWMRQQIERFFTCPTLS